MREGQTKLRRRIYNADEGGGAATTAANNVQHAMSLEGYYGFSVQVLQSLWMADECESNARCGGGGGGGYRHEGCGGASSDDAFAAASAADTTAAPHDPPGVASSRAGNSATSSAEVDRSERIQHGRVGDAHRELRHRRPSDEGRSHVDHRRMSMPPPTPAAASCDHYANSLAVARALEQFPGACPPRAQRAMPTTARTEERIVVVHRPPPSSACAETDPRCHSSRPDPSSRDVPPIARHADISAYSGADDAVLDGRHPSSASTYDDASGRLTNASIASMFSINSIRQLMESSSSSSGALRGGGEDRQNRPSSNNSNNNRETIESALSAEIRDLIRMAVPPPREELVGGNLAMDDMDVLVDREVGRFHKDSNMDYDRLSDLRFTDTSARWSSDSNGSTANRSKDSSSMDVSSNRSSSDNMSIRTSSTGGRNGYRDGSGTIQPLPVSGMEDSGDIASAELLLQLSR